MEFLLFRTMSGSFLDQIGIIFGLAILSEQKSTDISEIESIWYKAHVYVMSSFPKKVRPMSGPC